MHSSPATNQARQTSRRISAHPPRFSVIVPSFNAISTIGAAIASICAQEHAAEIIVVDGASGDGTANFVRGLGIDTLHCISEPDNGVYDAINKGVDLARGELIGVLGSDDQYEHGAFAAIAALATSSPADIYAGSTRFIAADGSTSLRQDEPFGVGALASGIPFGHNAMFATRSAYRRLGHYDLRYRICADADWVHRAIKAELTCSTTPEVVVNFAMQGLSSTNDVDILRETCEIISSHFMALPADDARALLYAVRGWSDTAQARRVVDQNRHNTALVQAMEAALPDVFGPASRALLAGGRPKHPTFLRKWLGTIARAAKFDPTKK